MSVDWICKIHSIFNYIKENSVFKEVNLIDCETIVIKKTNNCKKIELKFKDFRNINFSKEHYRYAIYYNESFLGKIICFIHYTKSSESGGGEAIEFTTSEDLVNYLVNRNLIKKITYKQLSIFDL